MEREIKAILKSHDLYLMIKSVGKYDKHDVSGRSFSRDNLWKERHKGLWTSQLNYLKILKVR